MPKGPTHLAINFIVAPLPFVVWPLIAPIWGLETELTWQQKISYLVGHIFATLIFSPDRDLVKSRFLPLNLLLWPYRKCSRHRGLSHWPLLGSLLKLSYLACLLWPICYWTQIRWELPFIWPWPFVAGVVWADCCHIGADWLVSGLPFWLRR